MSESHEKCIDALISEFGHDLVTSREYNYNLTKDDLTKIYSILNYTLFNNELGQIRLEYWPEGFIVDKLNEHALKSGVIDKKSHAAKCYGVFSAICKDVVDNRNDIVALDIRDEIIMMNKTYLNNCIFIFAVASICHEMIHFYNRFSTEFYEKQLNASKTNNDFDCHKDEVFQDMMREANAHGINVVESLANTPYKIANNDARLALKSVIGEDEDCTTHVNANDHRVTLRAKGSHMFTFIEFD
jgi:hypothetical protein